MSSQRGFRSGASCQTSLLVDRAGRRFSWQAMRLVSRHLFIVARAAARLSVRRFSIRDIRRLLFPPALSPPPPVLFPSLLPSHPASLRDLARTFALRALEACALVVRSRKVLRSNRLSDHAAVISLMINAQFPFRREQIAS